MDQAGSDEEDVTALWRDAMVFAHGEKDSQRESMGGEAAVGNVIGGRVRDVVKQEASS